MRCSGVADRPGEIRAVGSAQTLSGLGCLLQPRCQPLMVREDRPQAHLRELAQQTRFPEGEVGAVGHHDDRGPLPLQQVGQGESFRWFGGGDHD
ncbi:hypothetical protein G352_23396 [Rhodococcus ruber BKS 20-38]|uniref:Uncharacterized protein n=1 Tax=Rhodococcus ruber BKS 20-38 TaxID=1278076 RepID=M2XZL0_9NOCA|nr:hypothetical protein G352_23396 [Rhodococcus ruber BKS 20-38]